MHSLSEKIAELSSNVGIINTFKDKKEQDANFTENTNSLNEIGEGLAELETPIDIMIDSKIKIGTNSSTVVADVQLLPDILKMTNNFKKRFNKDKKVILEPFPKEEYGPEKNYKYFKKKCKELSEELNTILSDSWANYVTEKIPEGLNEELLALLKRAAKKEIKAIMSDIEVELKKIREIAKKLPKAEKVIVDRDKSVETIKEKWQEVDIKDEIINFLKEAHTRQGASFESLTTNVKDWLEKNGELKNAKIIFNQNNLYLQ